MPLVVAAPADDPDLAAAEVTAIAWLRRAEAARRADPVPLPYPLLMVLEAAASSRIDHLPITPSEVLATLAPGGTERGGPLVARLWALDRALRLGPTASSHEVADVAFEALVSHGAEPAGAVAGPAPRHGVPLTLAHVVADVAELERSERYGSLAGTVSRVVLSTWPARIGLLAGVPLVVSPSLTTSDAGRKQRLLLTAMADVGRRHVLAARAHASGRSRVADRLAALVPSTLLAPLTSVVARTTALTVTDLVATLGAPATAVSEPAASELTQRLEGAGVLRRAGTAADGRPFWIAPDLIDPVLEPFAEPGLRDAPARTAAPANLVASAVFTALPAAESGGEPWALGGVLLAVGLALLGMELAGARTRRRLSHPSRAAHPGRPEHHDRVPRLRVRPRH